MWLDVDVWGGTAGCRALRAGSDDVALHFILKSSGALGPLPAAGSLFAFQTCLSLTGKRERACFQVEKLAPTVWAALRLSGGPGGPATPGPGSAQLASPQPAVGSASQQFL